MSRILLVDDDDSFRRMLMLTLTNMGHAVVEASNGKEAIKLFEAAPPDVVLTDIVMPEKEGLETIGELRRKHPGVKIIAMSGGGRVSATDYLKIARKLGAAGVLAKPFSNQEMAMVLDEVLGGKPGGGLP